MTKRIAVAVVRVDETPKRVLLVQRKRDDLLWKWELPSGEIIERRRRGHNIHAALCGCFGFDWSATNTDSILDSSFVFQGGDEQSPVLCCAVDVSASTWRDPQAPVNGARIGWFIADGLQALSEAGKLGEVETANLRALRDLLGRENAPDVTKRKQYRTLLYEDYLNYLLRRVVKAGKAGEVGGKHDARYWAALKERGLVKEVPDGRCKGGRFVATDLGYFCFNRLEPSDDSELAKNPAWLLYRELKRRNRGWVYYDGGRSWRGAKFCWYSERHSNDENLKMYEIVVGLPDDASMEDVARAINRPIFAETDG